MRLPQVENGGRAGRRPALGVHEHPHLAACRPGADVVAAGPGSVQVELTSVEPTLCGWAGGAGSVTQPAEVAVEQPAAPATVQLQILTVCCGRLVVSAVHGRRRSVLPQFLPL